MRTAILDTSALIALHALDALSKINLLFQEGYVPRKVEAEFLTTHSRESPEESIQRFTFIEEHYAICTTWLMRCQEYSQDTIDRHLLVRHIGLGEAEVFAQHEELAQAQPQERWLIIDDRKARLYAKTQLNADVRGVVRLVAELVLRGGLTDYNTSVEALRRRGFKVSKTIAQQIWQEARRDLLG